jgi:hypothetical protein
MKDNPETSPDIIQTRFRSGDNQATLNIELEIAAGASPNTSSNSSAASSPFSELGGGLLGELTTGIQIPPRLPLEPIED